MNYYLKLENHERREFAKMVSSIFKANHPDLLPRVISHCQDIFVDELRLETDIAKNDALKVS